eukprot:scaffold2248_cov133-Isochrysis_galbana.AAC.10
MTLHAGVRASSRVSPALCDTLCDARSDTSPPQSNQLTRGRCMRLLKHFVGASAALPVTTV